MTEDRGDVRQVVMHPALWPAFGEWIRLRGLALARYSFATEDDLETWMVTIP